MVTKPAAGLTCGATYYVFKVNDFSVRLSPTSFSGGVGGTVFSWTPDSKSIVFWAGGKIRRVAVAELVGTYQR